MLSPGLRVAGGREEQHRRKEKKHRPTISAVLSTFFPSKALNNFMPLTQSPPSTSQLLVYSGELWQSASNDILFVGKVFS